MQVRFAIAAVAVLVAGAGKPNKDAAEATTTVSGAADPVSRMLLPPCRASFATLLSDEVFNAHAVDVPTGKNWFVPPNVKTGRAHLYRTVISDEAKDGPNFAGHYTIIRIGCGAGTSCVAIVDASSGRVYFPPQLKSAAALLVDARVETLNYRPNSNLIILFGMPNEEPKRAGMSYYLWRSGELRLLRFMPAYKLCGLPRSTQF